MKKSLTLLVLLLTLICHIPQGHAASVDAYSQGGVSLNGPSYEWNHGCAPTSAGMMMAYYDIYGYNNETYNNLVPGGTAGTNFSNQGLANAIIASSGHVAAYYVDGYDVSDDDDPEASHTADCLADFMGTSQDSVENPNGATTFYFYQDGTRITAEDILNGNDTESSGMYGIYEYLSYVGYSTISLDSIYNQYVDSYVDSGGFTLEDFMAEINAGRVVLIHVEGHTMFAYGYDDDGKYPFPRYMGRRRKEHGLGEQL